MNNATTLVFLCLFMIGCVKPADNRAAICAEMLEPLLTETMPGNQVTSAQLGRKAGDIFTEVSLKLPDDVELRRQFEQVRHEFISTTEASGGLIELNGHLSILGQKSRATNEDIEKWYRQAQEHLGKFITQLRDY